MKICIMSDRQKGLMAATKDVFPRAETRFCARHVYTNFRKHYSSELLRQLFWKIGGATNKHDFQCGMNEIMATDADAHQWLKDSNPTTWAAHKFDHVFKTDDITNNMTESWNGFLSEFRKRPVLELLEFIRVKVMMRMVRRREKAKAWQTRVPPRVSKKLIMLGKIARSLLVVKASKHEFEVIESVSGNPRHYVVNLQKKYCECLAWQLSGLPCQHILACVFHIHDDPTEYVDYSLTKKVYMLTYSNIIHLIPDKRNWPTIDKPEIQPPVKHTQPGRPKKNRTKEPNEVSKGKKRFTSRCGICNILGHNRRSCSSDKVSSCIL